MKIGKNTRKNIYGIIVMCAVYCLLFRYMSGNDIISAMLTSGSGASKLDVILSIFFIFLRIFIIVFLPGIILSMLVSENMVNHLWKIGESFFGRYFRGKGGFPPRDR